MPSIKPHPDNYSPPTKQIVEDKFYLKDYFDEKKYEWTKRLALKATGEYYDGSIHTYSGYCTWSLKLNNRQITYYIHQIVYLLDKGQWNLDKNGCIKETDHKDNNRSNNLLNNLDFETDRSKNLKKRPTTKAQIQSILPFVCWNKKYKKWVLQVKHKLDKTIPNHIGYYSTQHEAGLILIQALEERQPDLYEDENYMNDLILQVYDLYLAGQ